jgi:hypothetical protein
MNGSLNVRARGTRFEFQSAFTVETAVVFIYLHGKKFTHLIVEIEYE